MSDGVGPEVVVSGDALDRLGEYAGRHGWPAALVVMDTNTEAAAGRGVARALRGAGVDVEELIFDQRSGLHPDREQTARVQARIRGDPVPVPIAVGSGVITDVVRYAAHGRGRDFIVVATAASMDGYASSVAALQFRGVKVTLPARAPLAVFADPRVLAAAPVQLTRAGAGDLLAKATARVDWLASHLLCGEPFAREAADLMLEPLAFAIAQADAIAGASPEAVAQLLDGLIASGNAIALAGSSRPASGWEHHASHFWDLLASRGLRAHGSHGLQVGYATRFAIGLQRYAFAGEVAPLCAPAAPSDPLGADARRWLGRPTPEIVEAVAAKHRFIEASRTSWPADERHWGEIRRQLAPALALADGVQPALDGLGIAPAAPGYLGVDEPILRATLRHATRLRARYTTVDFLEGQGRLGEAVDALLT